jgi:tellurite resistance protein TehA-like permease
VAAYVVAHYFSLVAYNGQDLWRLARDPLGEGLRSGPDIDFSVVSATAIWYVQVIALVVGHVAALVLAHDRALVVYEDPRKATRSQIAMLVVMVIFTCLGLWLLSAANG